MTFDTELVAAQALAREYTSLGATISGMACAADHDPRWSDSDEEKLNDNYAARSRLGERLSAACVGFERDHREAWRAYLVASVARLAVLARNGEKGRIHAEYEHDRWLQWSRGEQPDDPAEIFARGCDVLAEHGHLVDDLIRAGR